MSESVSIYLFPLVVCCHTQKKITVQEERDGEGEEKWNEKITHDFAVAIEFHFAIENHNGNG